MPCRPTTISTPHKYWCLFKTSIQIWPSKDIWSMVDSPQPQGACLLKGRLYTLYYCIMDNHDLCKGNVVTFLSVHEHQHFFSLFFSFPLLSWVSKWHLLALCTTQKFVVLSVNIFYVMFVFMKKLLWILYAVSYDIFYHCGNFSKDNSYKIGS